MRILCIKDHASGFDVTLLRSVQLPASAARQLICCALLGGTWRPSPLHVLCMAFIAGMRSTYNKAHAHSYAEA